MYAMSQRSRDLRHRENRLLAWDAGLATSATGSAVNIPAAGAVEMNPLNPKCKNIDSLDRVIQSCARLRDKEDIPGGDAVCGLGVQDCTDQSRAIVDRLRNRAEQ
jgi:hypothetical protein